MELIKVAVIALTMSVAHAQAIDFKKEEDAVAHRQALMSLVRDNFSQLAPVLKKTSAYDAESFATYSGRLSALASWMGDAFEKNIQTSRTGAEDRIWHKDSRYKQLVAEFVDHTAHLNMAAASGEVDKIQGPLKQVADDCRQCHKLFRN